MNPREVTRFAVVLNGGVSLAVWMGGVTHELNRLRLASAGPAQRPTSPAEAAVHDAWTAILERAHRAVVVDTVAGTSAGGINGTLIAAAIAGGNNKVVKTMASSFITELGPAAPAPVAGPTFLAQVVGLSPAS